MIRRMMFALVALAAIGGGVMAYEALTAMPAAACMGSSC